MRRRPERPRVRVAVSFPSVLVESCFVVSHTSFSDPQLNFWFHFPVWPKILSKVLMFACLCASILQLEVLQQRVGTSDHQVRVCVCACVSSGGAGAADDPERV